MSNDDRTLLVVAGPGRSGTSLATGLLSRLGFYVPQPEVAADTNNPRGYSEPDWAVKFHTDLMTEAGVHMGDTRPGAIELTSALARKAQPRERLASWLAEQFEQASRVVVKDPRLFWFIDLYQAAAADLDARLCVLSMIRHPAEAVRSADRAYARLPVAGRLSGWVTGVLSTERKTRECPRAIVRHSDLMSDWRSALTRVDALLPRPVLGDASPETIAFAQQLVDPTLSTSPREWDGLDVPDELRDLAERVYEAVGRLPDGELRTSPAEIEDLNVEHRRMYAFAEATVWSSTLDARWQLRAKKAQQQPAAPPAPAQTATTPAPLSTSTSSSSTPTSSSTAPTRSVAPAGRSPRYARAVRHRFKRLRRRTRRLRRRVARIARRWRR